MSNAQRRALRTLIQVGLVQAVIQLYNAFAPHPLNAEQVSAITAFATPLLAFGQNWLEDNTAAPTLLAAPAPTPEPPNAGG